MYVLSFLHPRDLLRAAQTCRYWRILAEDNLLWREKCREAGLDDTMQDMMAFRKVCGSNLPYSLKIMSNELLKSVQSGRTA